MILGQITIILVLLGACLLTGGLFHTKKIVSTLPDSSVSWRSMFFLIIFFLTGYLLFAANNYGKEANIVTILVSLIFFGGGDFSYTW